MANENMTLDQMGGPVRSVPINIDITKGKPTEVPTNVPKATATPVPNMQARVVESGPIDFATMKPIDVHEILPQRAPKVSKEVEDMYSDLDIAIAREKESIDKRIDDVIAMQDKEMEAVRERQEMAALDRAVAGQTPIATPSTIATTPSTTEEDDGTYYTTNTSDVNGSDIAYEEPNRTFKFESTVDPAIHTVGEPEKKIEGVIDPFITTPDKDNNVMEEVLDTKEDTTPKNIDVNILDSIPNNELFDDEEDETEEFVPTDSTSEEEADKLLEDLKVQVKAKITPMKKNLDLSKFSINKKAVSASKVMKLAVSNNQQVADWVMLDAGRPISVSGLSGPEIMKLNPENSGRNRLNTFRDMYRVIYDHVVDANKPDFEVWMKQIRFIDLPHIYFALYRATFEGSNFMNYTCPNSACGKIFLKDITFEDMIDFKDESVREVVRGIQKLDTTSPSNDSYEVSMVQISDNYVFGLRTPSVWNIVIETATLSDQFLERHGDMIDIISYIDSIYYIDESSMTLVPIDTKPDANSQAKTSARRIKIFYDLIKTLSSDEFFALRAKIADFDQNADKITYKIPACTCPHCATEIPVNKNVGPDQLLFTRHQLAAIGNL